MHYPFEADRAETRWYEIAFFYGFTIIAGSIAVGLVIYYAL